MSWRARREKWREVDRRVGARFWRQVRQPAMPAGAWLVVDLFVAGLVFYGAVSVIGSASSAAAGALRPFFVFVVYSVAIFNFVRHTRPVDDT